MSLLIQQEDQGQDIYLPSFNAFAFKKIFNEAGMFEANFHLKSSNNRLEIHRLFDIDSRYKFTVNIQILKDRLIFGSSLLKNSQILVIKDITTRLIYWRLINKYFVENGLIITLTSQGHFMTKKVIFFQHFASIKSPARKSTEQQIKLTLFSFIQQTVLFYKCVIPKLQGDIVEISKSRVNYIKKYFMAVNLCNNSFFPTLEIYCKQTSDGHNMSKINEKRFKSSTKNNNNVKKSFMQSNNFMYHNDTSQLVYNQQKLANKQSSPQSIIENFNIPQMYQKIIEYKQKCENSMVQININPKSQPQLYLFYKTFVTNLEINFSKNDSRQNKIFNPVNILSPQLINWQPFDSTSLSQLKIAKIKYTYTQNQIDKNQITQTKNSKRRQQLQSQQLLQSTMILKHQSIFKSQQKHHFPGQLKWQKTIIQQCFKNDFCVYMTRFFIPVQQERLVIKNVQNFIFSQFMKRGTLHKWLTENSYLSSIFTKINIILYILYGVTFLHSKKVLHMDLKPQNILMDKSFVPKLTDFGSAYNKQVYEKLRKQKHHYYLSFSIPYTAPQIFMKSHKPQINAKCDIFSLGFIIYEILFNRSILRESNNLQNMFKEIGRKLDVWQDSKQKYGQTNPIEQTLISKIFICPQDMSHQYQVLILNLILRCLSCDQQKRPNLGMLIISLKQIFQMLIQFFAW